MKLHPRYKALAKCCSMPITSFQRYGDTTITKHGPMIHVDNGGSILGVGHLDYVLAHKPRFEHGRIHCGQLDDRLGVWGLLHGLERYTDTPYDILLCDSEEVGESTAQYFSGFQRDCSQYNWAFELDRAGTDAVLYDYDCGELSDLASSDGWKIGYGSFSDISYLDIGCEAINFGCGYHNQHTDNCYADLLEVESQLSRIGKFIDRHSSIAIPFDKSRVASKFSAGFSWQETYTDYRCQSSHDLWADKNYCSCENGFYECQDNLWKWTYCPYCGYPIR